MRWTILAAISVMLIACSGPNMTDSNDTSTNAAVVKSVYDAFAEGDIDGVTAAFTNDIVWNEAENFPYADGNPYIGPQAIIDGVFTRIGSEWDYWRLTTEKFLPSADHVVVLGRYAAKNSATAREINAQFVHVWRLDDEKIVSFQQYADTAQVIDAVAAE